MEDIICRFSEGERDDVAALVKDLGLVKLFSKDAVYKDR